MQKKVQRFYILFASTSCAESFYVGLKFMCRTFILNFQLFYGKYLFRAKKAQWWYFLWTLEIRHLWVMTRHRASVVSHVCETQKEAKARMLSYLFSSVSQIATICILKNWRMAFLDIQIQHLIFGWIFRIGDSGINSDLGLRTGLVKKDKNKKSLLSLLIFKNSIDDLALIFKNFKFVCQVFNFEELKIKL